MTILMLDVDGVLVSGEPDTFVRDAALDAELAAIREDLTADDWQSLATGQADLVDTIKSRRALPDADALLDYWYRSETRIDAAVLDGVRRRRAAGMKVFLATNQEHRRARYLMETLGLAAEVDGIVHSAALGHRKPSAGYFEAAALRVAARPQDIVFIDDNASNVDAARLAGWRATLWDGSLSLEAAISAAR